MVRSMEMKLWVGNKNALAKCDNLSMVEHLNSIPSPKKGIAAAPLRQSEMLKNTIRKFEVFSRDCFVATNEAISRELIVTVNADNIRYTTPKTALAIADILDGERIKSSVAVMDEDRVLLWFSSVCSLFKNLMTSAL